MKIPKKTSPAKKITPEKKTSSKKTKAPVKAAEVKALSTKGEGTIKFLAGGKTPKDGSLGRAHFETMKKFPLVADYLAQYEAGKWRKTASQWLGNFRRGGLVEVVKG